MEAFFVEMAWMLAALFIGVCIGSMTGLIPGFHVNNVALILLGISPALLAIGIPLSAAALVSLLRQVLCIHSLDIFHQH